MRKLQLLFLIVLFITAANCGDSSSEVEPSSQQQAEPAERFAYQCLSGHEILASYPSDSTAVVEYEGHVLEMNIAISASGARYIGGDYVWWTKGSGAGSEGTMYHLENGDSTGEMAEQCEQI